MKTFWGYLFWLFKPKAPASEGSGDQIHSENQMRQIFLVPAIVLVSKMVQNLKFGQTVNELRPFFEKSDQIWGKTGYAQNGPFFWDSLSKIP